MNSDIELRQLRYFLAVAEELHFTRAAERLRIAQPPLSRQIQNLEQALGVKLFERTNRRVSLTVAGQTFLEEVRKILQAIEQGIHRTQQVSLGKAGRLKIGFEGSISHDSFLTIVRQFRQQYPGIEIIVREMSSGNQVAALQKGDIDIGAIDPLFATADLTLQLLLKEPLAAAMNRSHPLADRESIRLSELSEDDWVTGQHNGRCGLLRRLLDACSMYGFVPEIRQEANDLQMMLGLIASGLGVTLLPKSVAAIATSDVKFVPLEAAIPELPTPEIQVAVAWPKQHCSPQLQAFLEVAQAVVGSVAKNAGR